jgi:hypothetical protein
VNGDTTAAPSDGLLTVTLASAGIAKVAINEERSKNFLTTLMGATKKRSFNDPP